jgi:hypothetical protein
VDGAPVTANFDSGKRQRGRRGRRSRHVVQRDGNYAGDQSGLKPCRWARTRGLWFRLDMPTSSSVSTQRSFTVEIEAQ